MKTKFKIIKGYSLDKKMLQRYKQVAIIRIRTQQLNGMSYAELGRQFSGSQVYTEGLKAIDRFESALGLAKDDENDVQEDRVSSMREFIQRQKQLQETQKSQWSEAHGKFDPKPFKIKWGKVTNRYEQIFLHSMMNWYSIFEGLNKANSTIKFGIGMTDSGVSLRNAAKITGKFFAIDYVSELLKQLKVSNSNKEALLLRYIAQEFPTKDNVGVSSNKTINRKADMMMEQINRGRLANNEKQKQA